MTHQHYYTKNPVSPHKPNSFKFTLGDNKTLFLTTDTGVFSKDKVDYGSECLIKSMPRLTGHILDLGCGYGVIGLSLALLNPSSYVTMVDINERAVALANENAKNNKIENVKVYTSDGFANVKGLFSTIVSNPPIRAGKKVIYPLFEKSIDFLEDGACLYLVIQKKQGAISAMEKLKTIYGNCELINKSGGYWILKSTKASF